MPRPFEHLAVVLLTLACLWGAVNGAQAASPFPAQAGGDEAMLGAEAYFHFAMAKLAQRQQRYDAAVAFLRQAAQADPESASIQAELANTFMIVRDYPAAEKAARRALELEPGHAKAHTVLAHLYYSRARRGIDPEENRRLAMQELEASLSGSPDDDPDVLLTLGRFYFEQADYQKASETLLRYAGSQPSVAPNVLFLLARAQIQVEDYQGAEQSLEQILNRAPDSLQALETLVNIRRLRGDYGGSLPLLEQIVALQGGDASLYKKMGEAFFHLEQYPQAMEKFQMALREEPGSPYSLYYLALCQERLGKLEEALETLVTMSARQEANTEVVFRMAQLQERLGQRDEAIRLYHQLMDLLESTTVEDEPPYGEIAAFCARVALLQMEAEEYNTAVRELGACRDRMASPVPSLELLRARALVFARRDAKALSAIREAGALFSGDPRFSILEGEILLNTGAEEEGTALLDEVLAAGPAGAEGQGTRKMVADAWFNAGAQAERRGLMARSERYLRQAIRIHADHAAALNYLGYTWADADRNLDEALELVQRAVQLEPENGAYQDSLGWVYFRLGRLQESRTALQRALELEETDPTIREHLGDVEQALGNVDRALELWSQSLEIGADDPETLRRKIREWERRSRRP